jgi:hypothetical protein
MFHILVDLLMNQRWNVATDSTQPDSEMTRLVNENNFKTKTIVLNAIHNGGKMRFRAAFLNRIVFGYFLWQWYKKGSYKHSTAKNLIFVGMNKVNG